MLSYTGVIHKLLNNGPKNYTVSKVCYVDRSYMLSYTGVIHKLLNNGPVFAPLHIYLLFVRPCSIFVEKMSQVIL